MSRARIDSKETEGLTIRMNSKLLERIEKLVADGYATSRSEFIRTATVNAVVEYEKRANGLH